MSEDPFDTDWWRDYAEHAMGELVPKMADSAITISLVPKGKADVKYALELGMSIMMDKPIIAVVTPGAQVPAKLMKVIDCLIEGDIDDPDFQQRLIKAINRELRKAGKEPS